LLISWINERERSHKEVPTQKEEDDEYKTNNNITDIDILFDEQNVQNLRTRTASLSIKRLDGRPTSIMEYVLLSLAAI
jgi:hypothetical protein